MFLIYIYMHVVDIPNFSNVWIKAFILFIKITTYSNIQFKSNVIC